LKIEVINTGTELLLGNVVNTHLSTLGKALFPLGLRIARQTTVPDGEPIREALAEAFTRSDLVIVTGGLGPTTDDVTREVTADLLGLELREDMAILDHIGARLAARGFTLLERMKRQAMVPARALALQNENGTAPGLYIARDETRGTPHLFLLPGPPRELNPMLRESVLPILGKLPPPSTTRNECRTYRVVGLGESAVEERIGLSLERRGDLEVGYCARPNEVDLRLISPKSLLDTVEPEVLSALGENIVTSDDRTLEEVVVKELIGRRLTLATAESCTGGLIAHRITNVPGSSEIFLAGTVAYANETKVAALGVPADLIGAHGAVSAPVAIAMAEGARAHADSDFALSTTGIAGPGGGTEEKPVGTLFLALARRDHPTKVRQEKFPMDRETFKQVASQTALDWLRREI